MKKLLFAFVLILFVAGAGLYYITQKNPSSPPSATQLSRITSTAEEAKDVPAVTVLAENFDTPWAIAFLPDNSMLITERAGTVRRLSNNGTLDLVGTLTSVKEIGEGGLMGIALHPDFEKNKYIYFYYTYNGSGNNTLNRVVRMTYENNQLSNEQIVIDSIPGASNHNGGRIKFGPDKLLYITTGDAQEPSQAQDRNSLAGKILRTTDDGKAATGNPFNNLIYSYGHRNPQGIAWDDNEVLWSTEHGPSGFETGNDELNKIISGQNYGWPTIRGTQTQSGMTIPEIESGTGTAWAPASLAFVNGKFYFSGLRGAALYEYDPGTRNLKTHFKGEYGRIREVITGPDGLLYMSTSNRDGRGAPVQNDDRIIQINPHKLQ